MLVYISYVCETGVKHVFILIYLFIMSVSLILIHFSSLQEVTV